MRDNVRTALYAGRLHLNPGRRCLFLSQWKMPRPRKAGGSKPVSGAGRDYRYTAEKKVYIRRNQWKFYITAQEGMLLK